MKNKILNFLIIFLLILSFFLILKYLDLSISDKYETQLEGLKPTLKEINEAAISKSNIDYQKKVVMIAFFISLLIIPFLFYRKKK